MVERFAIATNETQRKCRKRFFIGCGLWEKSARTRITMAEREAYALGGVFDPVIASLKLTACRLFLFLLWWDLVRPIKIHLCVYSRLRHESDNYSGTCL